MFKLIFFAIFFSSIFVLSFANPVPVKFRLIHQDDGPTILAQYTPHYPFYPTTTYDPYYPYPTTTTTPYPHYPTQGRAVVYFNPPDTAVGVITFWETSTGTTIISGQFISGFKTGEEANIRIKIYRGNDVAFDLKPSSGSLAKVFRIRPNGSTDFFMFMVSERLINGIHGMNVIVERRNELMAKDPIIILQE